MASVTGRRRPRRPEHGVVVVEHAWLHRPEERQGRRRGRRLGRALGPGRAEGRELAPPRAAERADLSEAPGDAAGVELVGALRLEAADAGTAHVAIADAAGAADAALHCRPWPLPLESLTTHGRQ